MAVRGVPTRRRVGWRVLASASLVVFALSSEHAAASSEPAADNAVGVHSMLYLNHPFGAKQAMFKEAAAVGASEIRLDIALATVFPTLDSPPDWSGVDQYMTLARRYRLRVLADLLATPPYMVDCPAGTPLDTTGRCAPSDPAVWGRDAGLIAAHTRGVIDDFEIINEPDGLWAFLGTPPQYAHILAASYEAIHQANPHARVALGGLMNIGAAGRSWTDAMLATLGPKAVHEFDIANIHVRTQAAQSGAAVRSWLHYYRSRGFTGPLWVTETGYPADPTQQTDPAYQSGPRAQAEYLKHVVPAMICAGAAKVFPTERDSLTGAYASEGFLQTPDPLPADPKYSRRPSFYVIRNIAAATHTMHHHIRSPAGIRCP